MNRMKRISTSVVGVIICAMILSTSADAQFLNKLTKGIDKVKKKVEKVDKLLNGQGNNNTKKNQNTASSSTSATTVTSNQGESTSEEEDAEEENIAEQVNEGDKELKELLKEAGHPYVTPETNFLRLPGYGNLATITNAYDGIFAVSMQKQTLDDHCFGFWTVDGKKLFDAEWIDLPYQSNSPEFHDGVVMMRKLAEGMSSPFYLLRKDGTYKAIPGSKTWFGATNFMDGLAIAHGPIGEGKCFFINTSGEKVFPHIVMYGMPLGGIRPLRDGLRAYAVNTGKWGYIDDKGVVKFPPKFKEAGDFSEGYAWVVTEDNVKQLIDKTGKSVFKLEDRNANTSEVVNGIFYVDEMYENSLHYYDITGKKLLTVRDGNQFFDGYAYIYNPKSDFDTETPIQIIDKDMKIVGALPHEIIEEAEVIAHRPKFNSKGYANVYSGLIYQGSSIIRPNGRIVMRRYSNSMTGAHCDSFSPVSDDGYIKARLFFFDNDGAVIMKTTGEILWIISPSTFFEGAIRKNDFDFPTKGFESESEIRFKVFPQ